MGGLIVQACKLSVRSLWRRKGFAAISLGVTTTVIVAMTFASWALDQSFRPTAQHPFVNRALVLDHLWVRDESNGSGGIRSLGARLLENLRRGLPDVERSSLIVDLPRAWAVYGWWARTAQVVAVDDDYWRIFPLRPLAGRASTVAGGPRREAVLSKAAAAELFPARSALGSVLSIGGGEATVVGVVANPNTFFGGLLEPSAATVWVSITASDLASSRRAGLRLLVRGGDATPAFAAAVEQRVRASWATMAKELHIERLSPDRVDATPRPRFTQACLMMGRAFMLPFPVVGTIVFVVGFALLLMSFPALGIATITQGRLEERLVEIGVRRTFGASPRALVFQLLVESVVVAGLAAALALAGLAAFARGSGQSPLERPALFLAACGFAVAFGVLSGIWPAWRLARIDPMAALRRRS